MLKHELVLSDSEEETTSQHKGKKRIKKAVTNSSVKDRSIASDPGKKLKITISKDNDGLDPDAEADELPLSGQEKDEPTVEVQAEAEFFSSRVLPFVQAKMYHVDHEAIKQCLVVWFLFQTLIAVRRDVYFALVQVPGVTEPTLVKWAPWRSPSFLDFFFVLETLYCPSTVASDVKTSALSEPDHLQDVKDIAKNLLPKLPEISDPSGWPEGYAPVVVSRAGVMFLYIMLHVAHLRKAFLTLCAYVGKVGLWVLTVQQVVTSIDMSASFVPCVYLLSPDGIRRYIGMTMLGARYRVVIHATRIVNSKVAVWRNLVDWILWLKRIVLPWPAVDADAVTPGAVYLAESFLNVATDATGSDGMNCQALDGSSRLTPISRDIVNQTISAVTVKLKELRTTVSKQFLKEHHDEFYRVSGLSINLLHNLLFGRFFSWLIPRAELKPWMYSTGVLPLGIRPAEERLQIQEERAAEQDRPGIELIRQYQANARRRVKDKKGQKRGAGQSKKAMVVTPEGGPSLSDLITKHMKK